VTDTEPEHDEDLARRAKHGDRVAFENLVRRHKDGLYRFVRRYIGQADDAYDVLQDCMVAAWLGLPRYDPNRAFAPWLRTIALNKCRDFGRRQSVRRAFLRLFAQDSAVGESTVEMATMPGETNPSDQRLDRLDKAIAELPAFYKEPLLLTSVSGLSHEAVAEVLSTTSKAVEMRVYRAKRKLAVIMDATKPPCQ
jgi:RNA polymerase sigma-70 factor (ECF subfamily)